MSKFENFSKEKLNKFVQTFDSTVNKVQGNPYLDELFKNLKNVKESNVSEAVVQEEEEVEALAKKLEEASAIEKIKEAEEEKTFI